MGYSFAGKSKKDEIVWKVKGLAGKLRAKTQKPQKGLDKFSSFSRPKDSGNGFSHRSSLHRGLKQTTLKKFVVMAVLAVAVIGVGSGVTGMVTYSDQLQSDLNSTQLKLVNAVSERDDCKSDLVSCAEEKNDLQGDISSISSDLDTCNQDIGDKIRCIDNINDTLEDCTSNLTIVEAQKESLMENITDLKDDIDALFEDYDELVLNTVHEYCCGAGETVLKDWGLDSGDNEIECNQGSYTVNCSSGKIEGYP